MFNEIKSSKGIWLYKHTLEKLDHKYGRGRMMISCHIVAYAPCSKHGTSPQSCGCPPVKTGERYLPHDLATVALASFVQNNIMNTAPAALKDTGNTSRTPSVNAACTVPMIVAGTNTTAAAVTDYALGTIATGGTYGGSNSAGNQAATVNAISGWSGTSGSYTVTGTLTNNSAGTIAYAEVGFAFTSATFTYLGSHDVFSALNVSNGGGTLAVTYTYTFQ